MAEQKRKVAALTDAIRASQPPPQATPPLPYALTEDPYKYGADPYTGQPTGYQDDGSESGATPNPRRRMKYGGPQLRPGARK